MKIKIMKFSSSSKRLFTRQFWKSVELKHYTLFILAVFFTFSSIGFVSDLLNNLHYTYWELFISVVAAGLLSAGYAFAATRKPPLIILFLSLQLAYVLLLRPEGTNSITPELLDAKFTIVAAGILFSITFGYAFFILFITKVGINHFLMKAEMDLAKSIHEVLVPGIKFQSNRFNVFGKSIPANEVGGDLIDLVENESGLFCLIADVSGHGVSSGVYTGMFKSSFRTILNSTNDLSKIINGINSSIEPMTKRNMFITSAIIKFSGNFTAEYVVAGHLPILYFNKSKNIVEELSIKQIPVGIKGDFRFSSQSIQYKENDIFLLITDGITEVSDNRQNQLGIEKIKTILKENSEANAENISERILTEVEKQGVQKDDVTLLIIKC